MWVSDPKLSAIVQPIAQIAASVPPTALFPVLLLALIHAGGGLGTASIALLLLGTQWCILFNIIAGAMAIPSDLKEVCTIYHLGTVERWRKLLLPAIFPYMLTGFVTASGGAWNASIVAEYVHFHGATISTTGLGAIISAATDKSNFPLLLAATVVMVAMVVTINRLLWRPLYGLAATKYKLGNVAAVQNQQPLQDAKISSNRLEPHPRHCNLTFGYSITRGISV